MPSPLLDATIRPIVCELCANNAHCIRRTPDRNKPAIESRLFHCATCNATFTRVAGSSFAQ